MHTTYIKRLALLGIALAIALPVSAGEATHKSCGRLVVFGTSLSDPGNAFALAGGTSTPPYATLDPLLIPSSPYAKGGHHFSNGATWIEQFARPLALAGNTRPAFQGAGNEATNYAVGGARARDDGINVNLPAQVATFLNAFGGVAPSDALYVIEMGGNDIRDALVASSSERDAILTAALTAIGNNIVTLYGAGARKFLVWNAPNLRLTPAIRTLDELYPGAGAGAEYLAIVFNSYLDGLLESLKGFPGIEIVKLDIFKTLNDIVANPAAFGVGVVDRACIMPKTPPFECKQPDEFLFWDGIHPTKAAHAIVAQTAAFALSIK